MDLILFHELIESETFKNVLVPDWQLYFETLFTSKNGFNLRNRIAHGFAKNTEFNLSATGMIFHSLYVLGIVVRKDK